MARPAKEFNEKKLKALMRLKPTMEDVAAFFECGTRTVESHIRNKFNLSFSEFREQNMVHTRFMLIRTAIQKAEKGDNVMLIFCLKNLCGWRDKPEEDKSNEVFKVMPTAELIALVKEKMPELESA